jgi:hypothetical protein
LVQLKLAMAKLGLKLTILIQCWFDWTKKYICDMHECFTFVYLIKFINYDFILFALKRVSKGKKPFKIDLSPYEE